jgi:hypothetical protein
MRLNSGKDADIGSVEFTVAHNIPLFKYVIPRGPPLANRRDQQRVS